MHTKIFKILFIILLPCIIMSFGRTYVYAAESSGDAGLTDITGLLSEYDFDEIDSEIKNASGEADTAYMGDFKELVMDIIGGGSKDSDIGSRLLNAVAGIFLKNKKAVMQIILLAVLSAAVNSFTPLFNRNQVSDIASMIIEISLISILIASFYTACTLCIDTIENCCSIYKSIIPVFLSAVTAASGSITAGAYYEIILLMISFVTGIFKNILIKLIKVYMFFVMADSVTGKERFTKICELIPEAVRLICKLSIILFTGMGTLKGLINPMTDSVKKNFIYKSLKLLPGIGSTVEAVSETVIGAGGIIKNGIGTAAMLILALICIIPIAKLFALAVLYKVTAAAIEPISDKKFVKVVNGTSIAISSLTAVTMIVLSLFILMLAVICIATS